MDSKRKKEKQHEESLYRFGTLVTRIASVFLGIDFTSLWNCTGAMNTIPLKLFLGVLLMVVDSTVGSPIGFQLAWDLVTNFFVFIFSPSDVGKYLYSTVYIYIKRWPFLTENIPRHV